MYFQLKLPCMLRIRSAARAPIEDAGKGHCHDATWLEIGENLWALSSRMSQHLVMRPMLQDTVLTLC
jgi:hypothetical protein